MYHIPTCILCLHLQSPDKPLSLSVKQSLPSSSSSESGCSRTVAQSSSSQQASVHVQKSSTLPYGVSSKTTGNVDSCIHDMFVIYLVICGGTSGHQQSQTTFCAHPKATGMVSGAHQPARHKNISGFTYSTSLGSGTLSSVAVSQRRARGRAGGECDSESHPNTKRARMSATADNENFGQEEVKGSGGRINTFITARDQHVSYVKVTSRTVHQFLLFFLERPFYDFSQ